MWPTSGIFSSCEWGSLLLSNTLSKKAQALLCYLALTGQPQSREKLAGLLWSDFPDRRARANLRDTLSHLHRVVSNSLTINQNWISLTVDPARSWIDVVAFQSAIEQVRQSLRRSHSPVLLPAELVSCLEEAVKLYRGELLSGFYVRRAVLFEEWLADRREQMRQLAVEALQILTAYYMAGGSYTAGLSHARHLLALEPWREEGHRQVMRLLALSGQQSAALIQYEACRRILKAELGLQPAVETTALCDAIRAGDVRPETVDTRGYELLELIGKGQMSSVYCAYQPAVKRKVAVKIVQAESPRSPQFFDRFESVTQTIAALEFPWIVPIYDFWRDADAATIVMRLMRGGNLKDNLDGKSWPVATAITLLEQIAAALAAAHEADIVHGNLKSENILLDEAGNAYLSDFGLASQAASGERLALAGGSASYLSPEQRLGQPATTRSDVYLIADPSLRLISISGPGGIGKTRLALAVARQQVDRFRQGVHFVSLLAAESSDQIISAIAAALALRLQNKRSPRQGLLDYLRDKHLLLVLDNFEHLVDEGDLLSAMLGGAARLTILVTTRELLNLHEEQVFPLAALARGDYLLARRHFSSSAAAYAACGLQAYAGLVHGFLFLAARGLGDEKTRLQLMAQGLRIQIAISQLGPLGICLGAPAVAVLLADHGYLAEAVAAYAFARSHPMIANSVWFDQVAGSVVRTAASALSAERTRQAEQRGRQSDPWQMAAEMLALVQSLLPKINLGSPNIF